MKKFISILILSALMLFMFTSCFPQKLVEFDDSTTKQALTDDFSASDSMIEFVSKLRTGLASELVFLEKPTFEDIGAKDALQFAVTGGYIVKIYEYDSIEALENAKSIYNDVTSKFVTYTTFLIETNDKKTKTVLQKLKSVSEESSEAVESN